MDFRVALLRGVGRRVPASYVNTCIRNNIVINYSLLFLIRFSVVVSSFHRVLVDYSSLYGNFAWTNMSVEMSNFSECIKMPLLKSCWSFIVF
ncbi:hypothetical protein Gasu2_51950 [Galdieria sulphuraria]|nr:hypothetical protein Gasu2_51950 [Galdieria sulphuraria]